MEITKLYSVNEICRIFNVSNWTLRRKIIAGIIPAPSVSLPGGVKLKYTETQFQALAAFFGSNEWQQTRQEVGLLNYQEAAHELGIPESSLRRLVCKMIAPAPTHSFRGGCRKYYRKDDVHTLRQAITKEDKSLPYKQAGLLTCQDMADAINISEGVFARWRRRKILPEPTVQLNPASIRLLYTKDDVQTLKEILHNVKRTKPNNSIFDVLEQDGFYSGRTASRLLGMPEITFRLYLNKKILPRPRRIGRGRWHSLYNNEDIAEMKEILRKRGYVYNPAMARKTNRYTPKEQ